MANLNGRQPGNWKRTNWVDRLALSKQELNWLAAAANCTAQISGYNINEFPYTIDFGFSKLWISKQNPCPEFVSKAAFYTMTNYYILLFCIQAEKLLFFWVDSCNSFRTLIVHSQHTHSLCIVVYSSGWPNEHIVTWRGFVTRGLMWKDVFSELYLFNLQGIVNALI